MVFEGDCVILKNDSEDLSGGVAADITDRGHVEAPILAHPFLFI